jgi:hypothetical protein
MIVYFLCTIFNSIYNLQLIANQLSLISVSDHTVLLDKYHPVRGKTYSLFGNCITTNFFYERVACLTDQILKEERLHQLQLLDYLQYVNRGRWKLRRNLAGNRKGARLSNILDLLHGSLQEFMTGIEEHLSSTPIYKIFTESDLLAFREQYYLYMIEFELINRVHKEEFLGARYKIALLPYCLRETQEGCKAEPDRLDYQCKGCRKGCYINHVSQILREHQVEPYIWRRTKLKTMLKALVEEHGTVGVMGIACIVQLVMGMRRCMEVHLPVVGIPLNANRCPRWMGEFHENSVDLNALEKLLVPDR